MSAPVSAFLTNKLEKKKKSTLSKREIQRNEMNKQININGINENKAITWAVFAWFFFFIWPKANLMAAQYYMLVS